jgi:oligoendopeptidase F
VATTDTALQDAAWDLGPLVGGDGEAGVRRLLAQALEKARGFAQRYQGSVGQLDATGLAAALAELAEIHDLEGRAGTYAGLSFSENTADPQRGALMQHTQEAETALHTTLLFFELEWVAVPDERAEELLARDELAGHRHHLRTARRYRPHLLSEPEERVLAERDLTASAAWERLYTEQVSALAVALPEAAREPSDPDGPVSLEIALSRLQSVDRQARRGAAEAVTAALEPGLRVRSYIFNTLMVDKQTTDRLRHYPHWLASRNLANEASDASVQALIEAVCSRYDLPQRWYRLKARLLGLDVLSDYDRSAPLAAEEAEVSWAQACELVRNSYEDFSPQLGELVGHFLDGGFIDAPVRPGKRGGAFCAYAVPSAHPYILLNYTGRRRDVLTLAHELGHGVHAALARPQGIFHFSTPLTVAETASTFGEELVFERLLGLTESDSERLGLLGQWMDDAVATVFRQVAMNRFEHLCHTRRREQGELSVEHFAQLWMESQREMMGDSVTLTEGYESWHSYVSHFIAVPGYVYAYAYGQLLALSVYQAYREQGAEMVPRLIDMLSAGGSKPPEELAAMVGMDLADPGFWSRGLGLIEAQLQRAEAAADAAG